MNISAHNRSNLILSVTMFSPPVLFVIKKEKCLSSGHGLAYTPLSQGIGTW